MTVTILGAGLAGLSCSYHIGHEHCLIFERKAYVGGHIATHQRDGCFWDEGPHVSFTRNETARALLAASVQ
jgi:protoporphyrinogen oxidase